MNSKHYIIIFSCLLFIFSGLATGFEGNSSTLNQSYLNISSEIVSAPDVLSIFANHELYLGKTIKFKGIVSKSYPHQHLFTVTDRIGCSICAAKTARNSITVSYSGKMPKILENVQISGLLISGTQHKYYVNATSVKF
jgi:uncharacterized membrane protein YcgQ (UPF0703/DUF1980 family)